MRGLPGDDDDDQARWIEATVGAPLRVCGMYLPNGNPAPGPKYDYKLGWMERLRARAAALIAAEEPAALIGDFNVIPEAEDCYDPRAWAEDALFLPPTREAYRRIAEPRSDRRGARGGRRARASTPSGTIRPGPGRRTTASASTTSC